MNQCLLEVEVIKAPTIRYTQDNKTAIAEMAVKFDGLRTDDAPGQIKVVGWGNLAQELPNRVQIGQRLVIEGRLRMTTAPREDGTKEKKAEFTLSRIHPSASNPEPLLERGQSPMPDSSLTSSSSEKIESRSSGESSLPTESESADWNSSPLIPDTDDIPF